MHSILRSFLALSVLAAAAGVGGCGGTGAIIDPGVAGPADDDSGAFLDRVADGAMVTQHDAMRGVLFLLEPEGAAPKNFGDCVRTLRQRNILPAEADQEDTKPIRRGELAYMIYQAARVPGGVILTLTGPSRRYCLRELQYRGLMGPGPAYSPVSGMEYVETISRADTYVRTGKVPDAAGQVDDSSTR